jgi:hypothetical protein
MNTLYDLVSRVLDARDGYNDPASLRRGLRAAIWGADQVTQRHAWTDYNTESIHQLNEPVEAVVSIDDSGALTIDSGTLPAWLAEASVKIGHRLHVVSARNSDTSATLENYSGPALPDQAVTFVHDRLILRDNVRQIYSVRNEAEDIELIFVGVAAFNTHQVRQNAVPSEPTVVTTSRLSHSRYTELRVSPAPAVDTTIRVSYYRIARKATLMHDCGSVTITDADLSIATIGKPMRQEDLFDLVLVLSENANRPDADLGFSVADDNPAEAQLTVTEMADPISIQLADDYAEVESRGGVLTQLLDLPPHTHEAAAMYAEAKYLQVGNGSHGDYWQTVKMADEELRTAMELESVLARQSSIAPRVAIYTRPETTVSIPGGS